MEAQVVQKKKINPWSDRTIIEIPEKQFRKLVKSGKCKTVQNYQWYVITKKPSVADIELFDKSGNKVNLKQLKQMLRRV